MRIIVRRFAAIATALAFLFAAVLPSAAADYPKEFRIGVGRDGLLVIVRQRKTLETKLAAHGVTVKWIEFASGVPLIEAINTGSLDYGYVGDAPPIFAQASGVPLAYVAALPTEGASSAILVKKDSPIKTIADLKGKRVGFTKGTSAQYLTLMALAKAGLTMADIQPVYLTPPDGSVAFASGQIDAWTIWDALFALAEAKHGARALTTAHGIVAANLFMVANRQFAETYPKLLKDTYDVLVETNDWLNAHKADAAQTFAANTGVPIDIEKIIVDRATFRVSPMTDAIVAEQQLEADKFRELGLLPKPIKVRDAVLPPPRS